jgi:hypothetical protein
MNKIFRGRFMGSPFPGDIASDSPAPALAWALLDRQPMPITWTAVDFRIGEGGLLRRLETAAHLTRIGRQIAIAISATWLPVMILGLIDEKLTGRAEPLLRSAAMHVRLLVAAPVFLFIDQLFPRGCSVILRQLVFKSFIPVTSEPQLERVLRSGARLANSWVPEGVLGLVSLSLGVAVLTGVMPAPGVAAHGQRTLAQLWYVVTDWPFVQFLLWRSLWRWVIWVRILCGLAFIPLALVPTHPDRRGGISFLRLPSLGYCVFLLFAISSMLCAEWGEKLMPSTSLSGFKPLLALFAGAGALIAFGPLLVFAPQLFRARRQGILDCGARACDEGRRFQRRILEGRVPKGETSGADVAAMSDVTVVYREAVDRLQIVLVDQRDLIALAIATLLPVLPMMLIRVPLEEWRELASVLVGGRF